MKKQTELELGFDVIECYLAKHYIEDSLIETLLQFC